MAALFQAFARATRTAEYIDTILTRLTTVGAIYLTLVCLLPEMLINAYNVPFYFRRHVGFHCRECDHGHGIAGSKAFVRASI
jgi:hypothetical protein